MGLDGRAARKSEMAPCLFEERCSLLEQSRMVLAGLPDRSRWSYRALKAAAAPSLCAVVSAGAAKLLAILSHDRGRRFEANAEATPVINIGALGGDAPNDILGGQNWRHLLQPMHVGLQEMQVLV
jgi:hypothetical protein